MAVFQIIAKPLSHHYNQKVKEIASLYSKGQYKQGGSFLFSITSLGKIFAPLRWLVTNFVQNQDDPNPMGASGGDSYKIFNQAEQEVQKMVGESAALSQFRCSILVLVGSDSVASAQDGINSILTSSSVFTNEYSNSLDNNQFLEGAFGWIVHRLHRIAFQYKLD